MKRQTFFKFPDQIPKVTVIMGARCSGKKLFMDEVLKKAQENNEKVIITRKKRDEQNNPQESG